MRATSVIVYLTRC